MSDPLFDTYVTYRLSTSSEKQQPGPQRGGPGCGCGALLLAIVLGVILWRF